MFYVIKGPKGRYAAIDHRPNQGRRVYHEAHTREGALVWIQLVESRRKFWFDAAQVLGWITLLLLTVYLLDARAEAAALAMGPLHAANPRTELRKMARKGAWFTRADAERCGITNLDPELLKLEQMGFRVELRTTRTSSGAILPKWRVSQ